MADVCDHWIHKTSGELVMSTAIITTEPCEKLRKVSDRMPVMITKEDGAEWLDLKNQDLNSLRQYVSRSDAVNFHAVGLSVSGAGKNRIDTDALLEPKIKYLNKWNDDFSAVANFNSIEQPMIDEPVYWH